MQTRSMRGMQQAGWPEGPSPKTTKIGKISVLIVDDDEMQRVMLAELFTEANALNGSSVEFIVSAVESTAEALSHVGRNKTDIILRDVLLPDVNGHDAIQKLKALLGDATSILMISAHAQISIVQTCLRRGADAFLIKPLKVEDIRYLWQYHRTEWMSPGEEKPGGHASCTNSLRTDTRGAAASEEAPHRSESVKRSRGRRRCR